MTMRLTRIVRRFAVVACVSGLAVAGLAAPANAIERVSCGDGKSVIIQGASVNGLCVRYSGGAALDIPGLRYVQSRAWSGTIEYISARDGGQYHVSHFGKNQRLDWDESHTGYDYTATYIWLD